MDQKWFYLIEQASDMSKIQLSFIIYPCCLNKSTKTINKLTNEQPSSHFFLTDPLCTLHAMLPLFWTFYKIHSYDLPLKKNSEKTECYHAPRGVDYRGTRRVTLTGRNCQKWSTQTPQSHGFYPSK